MSVTTARAGAPDVATAVVEGAYRSISICDFRALSDALADDVVVHVGGTSRHAGTIEGKETVLVTLSEIFAAFSARLRITVLDVAVHDGFVVTLCRLATPFDSDVPTTVSAHLHRVRDGRIAEAWFQPLDATR